MDFTEVGKNELWNLCNQCNPWFRLKYLWRFV